MPQASDETRARMNALFGDPIDDSGPINLLLEAGYTLSRGGIWSAKPGVEHPHQMAADEYDCLKFLIDEWDYDHDIGRAAS